MAHAPAVVGVLHLTMAFSSDPITPAQSIMPRLYFDIADGGLIVDEEDTEFPNVHAARDMAVRTLPHIAKDYIGGGPSREVLVLMRDENGRVLFTASLTLQAKWLVATT